MAQDLQSKLKEACMFVIAPAEFIKPILIEINLILWSRIIFPGDSVITRKGGETVRKICGRLWNVPKSTKKIAGCIHWQTLDYPEHISLV